MKDIRNGQVYTGKIGLNIVVVDMVLKVILDGINVTAEPNTIVLFILIISTPYPKCRITTIQAEFEPKTVLTPTNNILKII